MYRDATMAKFMAELAARTPTPGGGAAAALAGAAGAALAAMCAAYTAGKPEPQDAVSRAEELRKLFEALAARSLELLDLDAQAYGEVAAARALPQDTAAEKVSRAAARRAAREGAVRIPEETLEAARKSLDGLKELAPFCNPLLLSDVLAAAYLLEAAARGAGVQVRFNLGKGAEEMARASQAAARVRECEAVCAEITALAEWHGADV